MSACVIFRYIYKEEQSLIWKFVLCCLTLYVCSYLLLAWALWDLKVFTDLGTAKEEMLWCRIWIFYLLIYPWTILDVQSVFRQPPFSAVSVKIPAHGSLMASLCQERLRGITSFWAGFSITNQPELILQHFCICAESSLLRLCVTLLTGDFQQGTQILLLTKF